MMQNDEGFVFISPVREFYRIGMPIRCAGWAAGMLSDIDNILVGERKRVEVLVAVEGIGLLGALQPVDYQVSDGRGDDFVSDLEAVAGEDGVDQDMNRVPSGKSKGNNEDCIYCLANQGRPYGAGPKFTTLGEKFEACHRVRIGEFPCPKGDEAGSEDSRDKAEDGREGLLVLPSWGRRQCNDNGSHEI